MWRLRRHQGDRGATAVMFAIAILPLLAVGAIVGDTGLLYWEKAQLQNGADAAVLAVAEDCVRHVDLCESRAVDTATTIANPNANDGSSAAAIDAITVASHSGTVTITASSPDGNGVEHPFASVVAPQDATTLQARATAKWGVPVRGSVIPYAIGTCELTDARLLSGLEVVIENTNRTSCSTGGPPGGFGWLDPTSGCEVDLSLGARVHGDTGSWGSGTDCDDALDAQLCSTILVPIYDVVTENADGSGGAPHGTNAYYHIEKFAAIVLNGWMKDGHHNGACVDPALVPQLFNAPNPSGGRWPNSGIQGHFVRFVTLDEAFELGAGPDGGVIKVELSPDPPLS